MAFDLVKATDKFLCRDRFHGHGDCHFYPSEASVEITDSAGKKKIYGSCLRASYFRCTGAEGQPHSARSESIFELGRGVESILIELWKQMGIFVADHVRWQNMKYNLSGELDVVLREPDSGTIFGTEVKSFYGYQAGVEILGNRSVKPTPKMNNLLQALIYAHEFRETISYFKLFYIERGDGTKQQFDVRSVPDTNEEDDIVYRPSVDGVVDMSFTVNDIYKRYNDLMEYMISKQVPPQDFELFYTNDRIEEAFAAGDLSKSKYEAFKKVYKNGTVKYSEKDRPGDWQCSYCRFKSICYGELRT